MPTKASDPAKQSILLREDLKTSIYVYLCIPTHRIRNSYQFKRHCFAFIYYFYLPCMFINNSAMNARGKITRQRIKSHFWYFLYCTILTLQDKQNSLFLCAWIFIVTFKTCMCNCQVTETNRTRYSPFLKNYFETKQIRCHRNALD